MRRCILPLLSMVFLMAMGFSRAEAAEPDRCISSALVLPLLGGAGDTPIIPVRVENRDAAMYLSTAFDRIYVRNLRNFNFHDGHGDLFHDERHEVIVQVNGYHSEEARQIVIDDFQIGKVQAGPVNAIQLFSEGAQSVDGRPLVGVLGVVAFTNLQVLLDIPHRQVAFLTMSDSADCHDAARDLMGKNAHAVEVSEDFQIPVTIDGKTRWVRPNPDLSSTVLPGAWGDLPELSPSAVGKGELTVTHYDTFTTTGRRLSLADFRMDGVRLSDGPVAVQRDIQWAMLGLPFFENRVVLFDYPHHRFYFAPSETVSRPAGHDLHFEATIGGVVSIRERRGKSRQDG
ncbi:hypothetical protein ACMAUO_13540 [Gluconacetobacter sp. Hr-1-5]|uniref:hypothetical protein n=1 Tax=Gluconacetobacter sp. Hr-1-5 TaxID=3395370 RepID=UPI003B51D072